ncbi:hypothetical protein PsorP6_014194 [Peronosclerospora sorghi]|uniref:Uncharacterized protein n=1 Tax=Peronosclerospora sorghi TaxID=230839 RepID=A0ACC0VH27_9STRA|nr:hypothetical protein PsorP6_014194 [Peronosclerospora sorghi]
MGTAIGDGDGTDLAVPEDLDDESEAEQENGIESPVEKEGSEDFSQRLDHPTSSRFPALST